MPLNDISLRITFDLCGLQLEVVDKQHGVSSWLTFMSYYFKILSVLKELHPGTSNTLLIFFNFDLCDLNFNL